MSTQGVDKVDELTICSSGMVSMGWRIIVAGFATGIGFVSGWVGFGSFDGALLSALFLSGIFLADRVK